MKAHFILDPVTSGMFPFSLAQSKQWKYGCSECGAVSDDLGAIQTHTYTKHPSRKKDKKEKVYRPSPEKLRKPNATERSDIREAIRESRDLRIKGMLVDVPGNKAK
jgi:hypothetical protein